MTASTSAAVITLIGTLGGVVLTGGIGYLRTWSDHRHEREIKQLDVALAAETSRRSDRRSTYHDFLTATDGAYQLAADLYARKRDGATLDFRSETRDVVSELMRRELAVALVGTVAVRRDAKAYVQALRQLLLRATEGTWSDDTEESRTALFASMISDVNPGHEATAPT